MIFAGYAIATLLVCVWLQYRAIRQRDARKQSLIRCAYKMGYERAEDDAEDYSLEQLSAKAIQRGMPRRRARALAHQLRYGQPKKGITCN